MKITQPHLKQLINEEVNIMQERALGSLRALKVGDVVKRSDGKGGVIGKRGEVVDVISGQGGENIYDVKWGAFGRPTYEKRDDLVLQEYTPGLRLEETHWPTRTSTNMKLTQSKLKQFIYEALNEALQATDIIPDWPETDHEISEVELQMDTLAKLFDDLFFPEGMP